MNNKYPSIASLQKEASQKVPGFAFEYLEGGCNEEVNLRRNTEDIRAKILEPQYIDGPFSVNTETHLFGQTYSAPFGIAPIGLQGLIWPGAPEILAAAAAKENIPFILSTVSTASIEKIATITEGKNWFQLYYPSEQSVRDDILNRAAIAGVKVLVLLSDVPSFGIRYKDIKNGLALPPKMSLRNIMQIIQHPDWAIRTLLHGKPEFVNMNPYMPKGLNLRQLGSFMNQNFSGRLTKERLLEIRSKWKGKLVLKGVASEKDAEIAREVGMDGIIISNHGGRQLDNGESTICTLNRLAHKYQTHYTVMMDSGIRTGADVAVSMASGAQFTFMGRTFMYGVGALGNKGGLFTIQMLKKQLQQVMEQVGAPSVKELPQFLLR
ncbi:MAG: alpha-hydroxy acid oxidase [Saprospiraceae bacterium]|jgi:L-lactate dehydrogenase (cytochrome)